MKAAIVAFLERGLAWNTESFDLHVQRSQPDKSLIICRWRQGSGLLSLDNDVYPFTAPQFKHLNERCTNPTVVSELLKHRTVESISEYISSGSSGANTICKITFKQVTMQPKAFLEPLKQAGVIDYEYVLEDKHDLTPSFMITRIGQRTNIWRNYDFLYKADLDEMVGYYSTIRSKSTGEVKDLLCKVHELVINSVV